MNKLSKALIIASLSMALVSPVQAATHQEVGRMQSVFYDQVAQDYECQVCFTNGEGYVFSLDIQGPENELILEALNRMLTGNVAELTIDDMGTDDIYDDEVVSAIF